MTTPLARGLQCPRCSGPLDDRAAHRLSCALCAAAWPIQDGVWCFGQSDAFPQDLPAEQISALLGVAQSSGWQMAMHDHLRRWDPGLYRRAVDEYRAQWKVLVPCHPEGWVLDLRCGWGPIAISLAEDYGHVVAADTCRDLAAFTAIRAQAHGIDNLQPVCLDPSRRMPFQPGTFEVAILHDVLEWSDPAALLGEIARVLAPGGSLFMSAGNRLSVSRALQSVQPGERRASRPRARPRTLSGYRRLLAAAGFAARDCYAILPSTAEPFYIIPLDQPRPIKFFLDSIFSNPGLHLALAKRHLLAPLPGRPSTLAGRKFLAG